MAREEPKINLRVSQELKDKITARAAENKRSVNAEMVQILEDALSGKAKSIEFNFGDETPIKINNVDNPVEMIGALIRFAEALTAYHREDASKEFMEKQVALIGETLIGDKKP